MNTLKYAKILEASGVARNQAETHAQVLHEAIGETMVTKQDLTLKTEETKKEIQEVRAELLQKINTVKEEIQEVRAELLQKINTVKEEIQEVRTELIQKIDEKINESENRMKIYITDQIERSEYRIVIKLGVLMTTLFSMAIAAVGVLF